MLFCEHLERAITFVSRAAETTSWHGSRDLNYAWVEPEGDNIWVVATNGQRMAVVLIESVQHAMTTGMGLSFDCLDDDPLTGVVTLVDGALLTEAGTLANSVSNEFVSWRKALPKPEELKGDCKDTYILGKYHQEAIEWLRGFGEFLKVETWRGRTLWRYSVDNPVPFSETWVIIAPVKPPGDAS